MAQVKVVKGTLVVETIKVQIFVSLFYPAFFECFLLIQSLGYSKYHCLIVLNYLIAPFIKKMREKKTKERRENNGKERKQRKPLVIFVI